MNILLKKYLHLPINYLPTYFLLPPFHLKTLTRSLNDNPLYGKIPNLKRNEKLNSYFFENTNLCFDEREDSTSYYVVTPELSYSYPKNNCKECADNASLVDDICQCDSGYVGLGYIYCVEEDETGKKKKIFF